VTADHWSFVLAAYGLAAVVLVAYWRFLVRRERELSDASVVGQQLSQGSSASESQATVSRRPSP
jgi:hypothetical protein